MTLKECIDSGSLFRHPRWTPGVWSHASGQLFKEFRGEMLPTNVYGHNIWSLSINRLFDNDQWEIYKEEEKG